MKEKSLINELNDLSKQLKEFRTKVITELITEGVDDPGILKCVFMAGGPGSGKSYIANEIFGVGKKTISSVSAGGLKLVNSDTAFESALKKNGINPGELAKIEKTNKELWTKIAGEDGDSIRNQAKKITQQQQAFYEMGRLGMIIDGTGDDFNKIKKKKEHAESLGYDCYMIFVNTSLQVAQERNALRSRKLPKTLVSQIWKACQHNLGSFQSLFKGNFVIVDNTEYKKYQALVKDKKNGVEEYVDTNISQDIQKAVDSFLRKPIQNPIGKRWVEQARLLKKLK